MRHSLTTGRGGDEISRSRLLKKPEDMKLKSEGYTAAAWDSCIDSVKSVTHDM